MQRGGFGFSGKICGSYKQGSGAIALGHNSGGKKMVVNSRGIKVRFETSRSY